MPKVYVVNRRIRTDQNKDRMEPLENGFISSSNPSHWLIGVREQIAKRPVIKYTY